MEFNIIFQFMRWKIYVSSKQTFYLDLYLQCQLNLLSLRILPKKHSMRLRSVTLLTKRNNYTSKYSNVSADFLDLSLLWLGIFCQERGSIIQLCEYFLEWAPITA